MLANFDILRLSNPHLSDFLSQVPNIRAIFLDMFCTYALDVARNLNIPPYIFFASSASTLIPFVLMPNILSQITTTFNELGDTLLHFPGIPPIPASHMPSHFHVDSNSDEFKGFVEHLIVMPKADGIVVNTFEMIEKEAVQALNDGRCYPGRPMPPVYCVGPLTSDGGSGSEKHECIKWLDVQPKGSVVFLCFGSAGAFSKEQLGEIAKGLERSGQRFLWVVRNPEALDRTKKADPTADVDLDGLLPEGFLERTKEAGMVVKAWAPQAEVLKHEAVGGFVSHVGWNSTLEAVSAGVPIVAWPLYAEQRMNKVFLTEAKMAVEMKGYDEEIVRAEEIEAKVRWLIESEEGRDFRERAKAMKESAIAAKQDGGSSMVAWAKLMARLREN